MNDTPDDTPENTTEARRAALRRFVAQAGGNAAVATRFKLKTSRVSYLSQLIAKGSRAPFGERSARNWQTLLAMKGDPLLYPAPLASKERRQLASIDDTVASLREILRAVPADQREVIASVLSAFARKPVAELGVALVTLLQGSAEEESP